MTHTFTNLLAKTLVPLAVISSIILGSFVLTNQAQAAASDAVIERTLPILVSGAALAFSAITERAKPGALVNASVASEQKLAELMKLLEQLTAMYQSALKQKAVSVPESVGTTVDDEVATKSFYYIDITAPDGGESFVFSRHVIAVLYDSNVQFGEKRTIYLEHEGDSSTKRLVHSSVFNEGKLVRIDLAKIKLPNGPGKYKFIICAPMVAMPTGVMLCNKSANYFSIVPANEIPLPVVELASSPSSLIPGVLVMGDTIKVFGKNLKSSDLYVVLNHTRTYAGSFPTRNHTKESLEFTLRNDSDYEIPNEKFTLLVENNKTGFKSNKIEVNLVHRDNGAVPPQITTLRAADMSSANFTIFANKKARVSGPNIDGADARNVYVKLNGEKISGRMDNGFTFGVPSLKTSSYDFSIVVNGKESPVVRVFVDVAPAPIPPISVEPPSITPPTPIIIPIMTPETSITFPTANVSIGIGQTRNLSWTSFGQTSTDTYNIYLATHGSKGLPKLLGSAKATSKNFSWTVSKDIAVGSNYKIQLVDTKSGKTVESPLFSIFSTQIGEVIPGPELPIDKAEAY